MISFSLNTDPVLPSELLLTWVPSFLEGEPRVCTCVYVYVYVCVCFFVCLCLCLYDKVSIDLKEDVKFPLQCSSGLKMWGRAILEYFDDYFW